MKVLFVCTGNTCRSPIAEAVFNSLNTDDNITSNSARISIIPGSKISKESAELIYKGLKLDLKNINSYSISQIIKMYIEFWYFSVITFSTVGFGDMIINGIIGKILVCFEVFIGITIQSTWAALIIKRMFR